MSKSELWLKFCEKNPHFLNPNENSRLRCSGLKKLFDQAFEHGRVTGHEEMKNQQSIFHKVFGDMP
jgi:hypothetical protein